MQNQCFKTSGILDKINDFTEKKGKPMIIWLSAKVNLSEIYGH